MADANTSLAQLAQQAQNFLTLFNGEAFSKYVIAADQKYISFIFQKV
jgi:hypothetical protein